MRLSTTECRNIKEIVVNKETEGQKGFIFSCVHKPKPSSYSGNHAFSSPSSEVVVINKCPEMKIFSHAVIFTLKLEIVLTEDLEASHGYWEDDLYSTVQK
jgi:hypothetical protein